MDKTKIETIEKIVELAKKRMPDTEIGIKTGTTPAVVMAIRKLFGILYHKTGLDIREIPKKVYRVPFAINFSLVPFQDEFGLDQDREYEFKAIKTNPATKTITIQLSEM